MLNVAMNGPDTRFKPQIGRKVQPKQEGKIPLRKVPPLEAPPEVLVRRAAERFCGEDAERVLEMLGVK